MSYNKDIINLFINQYINNTNLKTISNNLNISIQTLKRWIIIYSNNIVNKTRINSDFLKIKNYMVLIKNINIH